MIEHTRESRRDPLSPNRSHVPAKSADDGGETSKPSPDRGLSLARSRSTPGLQWKLGAGLRFGPLLELACQQPKLLAPPGAPPPRQPDLARRIVGIERSGHDLGAEQQPGADRELGQQRDA